MGIIYRHEKKRFKEYKQNPPENNFKPEVQGDGFIDSIASTIPKITEFVSNNKDLISSGAKAVSSVANTTSKIVDAVKENNKLKELQAIREARNRRLEEQMKSNRNTNTPSVPPTKKRGDGFKVIG